MRNRQPKILKDETHFWQPVTLADEDGAPVNVTNNSLDVNLKASGKSTGTLFGDDMRVTRRVPISSGKYNQGLPIFAANYNIVGSGYWKVVEAGGVLNGASEFATGTDSNGKIYLSSKLLNRYEAGQLSYYLFTAGWNGISSSDGDFIALVGASLPGLVSDGEDGDIKEGYMFGWVRDSTSTRAVVRVYKNFNYTEYTTGLVSPSITENMSIYELETGYLGIHPALLYRIDTTDLTQSLLQKVEFNSDTTNVNEPNLAISVYVENKGNTSNITLRNGSFQYGNYAERPSPDASSRRWLDTYTLATVASGTDTVVAVYQVPEKVTMHKQLDSGGTTTGIFRNTITNRLDEVNAVATSTANKSIGLSVYLVPKTDVTATYTAVNPYINVLERAVGANITSVSLANATKIVSMPDIRRDNFRNVQKYDHLLNTDLVGVVTVSSSNTISDLEFTLNTEDLF